MHIPPLPDGKGAPGADGKRGLVPWERLQASPCPFSEGDELRLLQQRRELHRRGPAFRRGLDPRPLCAEGGKFCWRVELGKMWAVGGWGQEDGAGPGGVWDCSSEPGNPQAKPYRVYRLLFQQEIITLQLMLT